MAVRCPDRAGVVDRAATPMNFDATTELVTAEHMSEQFGCGPAHQRL
jgi:hypothetical protein